MWGRTKSGDNTGQYKFKQAKKQRNAVKFDSQKLPVPMLAQVQNRPKIGKTFSQTYQQDTQRRPVKNWETATNT